VDPAQQTRQQEELHARLSTQQQKAQDRLVELVHDDHLLVSLEAELIEDVGRGQHHSSGYDIERPYFTRQPDQTRFPRADHQPFAQFESR
jgi:hypothetical protein